MSAAATLLEGSWFLSLSADSLRCARPCDQSNTPRSRALSLPLPSSSSPQQHAPPPSQDDRLELGSYYIQNGCMSLNDSIPDGLASLTLTRPCRSQSSADLNAKIASLHSRISKERKIMEGFHAMRSATSNQDVIRTCEAKIRESNKTIGWFEDSLRELEGRVSGAAFASGDNGRQSNPALVSGGLDGGDRMHRQLPPPPPGAAPSSHHAAMGSISARDGSNHLKQNFTSLGELTNRISLAVTLTRAGSNQTSSRQIHR